MKPILFLPLVLAACACPPLTRAAVQNCQQRAEAGLIRLDDCLCDRPTASLADTLRERGDKHPAATRPEPEPEEPEPEPEPEEPEEPSDKEPDRKTDPDGWRDWRDRTPRGGA